MHPKFLGTIVKQFPYGQIESNVSIHTIPECLKTVITAKACTDLLAKVDELQDMVKELEANQQQQ